MKMTATKLKTTSKVEVCNGKYTAAWHDFASGARQGNL